MNCLADNEIYPENLDINNYAIGYQDFLGIGSRSEKSEPVAPDNENYMRGWFAAHIMELERKQAKDDRVNPIYSKNRVIKAQAKAIHKEWEKLATEKGWWKSFPT